MSGRKLPNNTTVTIQMTAEVTTLDGEDKQLVSERHFGVKDLIAFGLILQQDIYNEMEEEIDNKFNTDGTLLFISGLYVSCYIHTFEAQSEDDFFYIQGNEFIPQFRGLHK